MENKNIKSINTIGKVGNIVTIVIQVVMIVGIISSIIAGIVILQLPNDSIRVSGSGNADITLKTSQLVSRVIEIDNIDNSTFKLDMFGIKAKITTRSEDISDDEIVKQMVGRELTNVYPPKEDYRTDETILKVEHLCSIHERSFQDCSFELKRGEILGFGGLVGAQRTEMMEAIFGMRHIASGTVEVLGKKVNIKKPEDAIDNSIGMITEDRRGTGILGCLSINDNTAIASYKNYTNSGVIDQKKVDAVVKDSIQKLNIKTPSGKTRIQSLSGGNQQKVIIARWLANNPDILIMDEPTRGIDVGAKYEIYQIMIDLVKQGKSIIMISSEMPELIGMSNRIIVMCNGHITGEVEGEEATQERIMSFATQFDLQGKSTTESK